jgi:hypothetical protein
MGVQGDMSVSWQQEVGCKKMAISQIKAMLAWKRATGPKAIRCYNNATRDNPDFTTAWYNK